LWATNYERTRTVKLIITEEDRQFIETIVQRFDPARILRRPASVSAEDWSTYLGPLQSDLRQELEATLLAQALKDAGLIDDVTKEAGQITQGWNLTPGASRRTEAWDGAYARITEGWTSPADDEDRFLGSWDEAVDHALDAAISGAV
jgi:hypothetical protein